MYSPPPEVCFKHLFSFNGKGHKIKMITHEDHIYEVRKKLTIKHFFEARDAFMYWSQKYRELEEEEIKREIKKLEEDNNEISIRTI